MDNLTCITESSSDEELYLTQLSVRDAHRNWAQVLASVRAGIPAVIQDKKTHQQAVALIPANWLWILDALNVIPTKFPRTPVDQDTIMTLKLVVANEIDSNLCRRSDNLAKSVGHPRATADVDHASDTSLQQLSDTASIK